MAIIRLAVFLATVAIVATFVEHSSCDAAASYIDIPMPTGTTRTPNLQKFWAGCLVIDMGERQIENTEVQGKCSAGFFNLMVYGYAARLLQAGVPLNWAIASNKAKDQADLVASSHRVHPTGDYGPADGPWGAKTTQMNSFKGGPLVVRRDYADKALQVLEAWKSQQPYDGCAKSIVVFRLDEDKDIDVRHVLLRKPHALISTVSNNYTDWGPAAELFERAGLIQGDIRTGHYELVTNSLSSTYFNENSCHTIFIEPHVIFNSKSTANCPRCQPVPSYRDSLFKFIDSGGNFAAQCASIPSYENLGWSSQYRPEPSKEGSFFSREGIKAFGDTTDEWGGRSDDTALTFPHPDLPAVQFVGPVSGAEPGTVTEFYVLGSGDEKTLMKNNGHSLVENSKTGQDFRKTQAAKVCTSCGDTSNNLLPDGRRAFIAAASKVGTNQVGGMVFYLGSHSWQPPSRTKDTEGRMNGRRILLNAFLTPATRPDQCAQVECPEGAECPSSALLGTCQQCVCRGGKEVITPAPARCGTCESCGAKGNCEVAVNRCPCGQCVQSATARYECKFANSSDDTLNCTVTITGDSTSIGDGSGNSAGSGDGDGSSSRTAAVVGGIIGGTIGALLVAIALMLLAVFLVWRHASRRKRGPRFPPVKSKMDKEGDARNNPIYNPATKTYENQLYDEEMMSPHAV